MYGTKQAGRCWYLRVIKILCEKGLIPTKGVFGTASLNFVRPCKYFLLFTDINVRNRLNSINFASFLLMAPFVYRSVA